MHAERESSWRLHVREGDAPGLTGRSTHSYHENSPGFAAGSRSKEGRHSTVTFRFRSAVRALAQVALAMGIVAFLDAAGWVFAQEQTASPAKQQSSPDSGYLIGPTDVLQVVVWKEPDLTREVTVRMDGMITVPLLGDVPAAGQAPDQLAASLEKALERYVEAPKVVVIVSRAASARFYVVGQVVRSGEFPLSGRTTVLQGLALAGGFKEFAKLKDIVIIQSDGTVFPFNFERITSGKDMTQNVVLQAGDTIVVP